MHNEMPLADDQTLFRTPSRKPRFMFGTRRQSMKSVQLVQHDMYNSQNGPPGLTPQRPSLKLLKTTTSQLKRSRSSYILPMSFEKRSTHGRKMPSPRIEIVNPWNEDAPHWSAALSNDTPLSPSSNVGPLSPLPSSISPAAAKRLGIEFDPLHIPGSAPLASPIDWAIARHHRDVSTDTQATPPLDANTFYSSESDGGSERRERSSTSSYSSRTSYTAMTPDPTKWSVELESTGKPCADLEGATLPVPSRTGTEDMTQTSAWASPASEKRLEKDLPPLPESQSTRTLRPVHQQHPKQVRHSIDLASIRRGVDLAREEDRDDFQTVLNGIADNIRGRLQDAVALEQDVVAIPPVPRRSSRRLLTRKSELTLATSFTQTPTSAVSPADVASWVERRQHGNISAASHTKNDEEYRPSLHPATRSSQQEELPVTPTSAEVVILHIFSNFSDLRDLFATARVNRGFYSVYKRHEMRLLRRTVNNQSPAAWEMLEVKMREVPVQGPRYSSRIIAPVQTPARYLQLYRRHSYILTTLKSMISSRCQSCLRPETLASLRQRTADTSRVEGALWRISTFCAIFGSGRGREDDIVGQMDWLRGGAFAQFAASDIPLERTKQSSDTCNFPSNFGRGNIGGLSTGELKDMLEMWDCLKHLLQGILGGDRVAQAGKYAVFDSVAVELAAGPEVANMLLEEWYHFLCTLGLSTILDLATPSTSKTGRVFHTARDKGWTQWSPPSNGGSRSDFLRTAIQRVLDEQAISAPTQLRVRTSSTALNMQSRGLDDSSMSQWIKYIAGLESAPAECPLPARPIAAQQDRTLPAPPSKKTITATQTSPLTCPPTQSTPARAPPAPPVPASAHIKSPKPLRPQNSRLTSMIQSQHIWQEHNGSPADASTPISSTAAIRPDVTKMLPLPPMPPMVPLSRFNSVRGDSWVVVDGLPVRRSLVLE